MKGGLPMEDGTPPDETARCQRAAAYLNERLVSRSGTVEQRPQLTCLKAKTSLRRRNTRKVPLDRSAFSDSPSEYHSDKGRTATDKREFPRKQERNYRRDCCRQGHPVRQGWPWYFWLRLYLWIRRDRCSGPSPVCLAIEIRNQPEKGDK